MQLDILQEMQSSFLDAPLLSFQIGFAWFGIERTDIKIFDISASAVGTARVSPLILRRQYGKLVTKAWGFCFTPL